MSDLLDRLIRRATGAPSRVEPALPSAYESMGPSDSMVPVQQPQASESDPVVAPEARVNGETKKLLPRADVHQQVHSQRNAYEPRPREEGASVADAPALPRVQIALSPTREDGMQTRERKPTGMEEPEPQPREPATPGGRMKVHAASWPSDSALPAMVKTVRKESRSQSIPHASTSPKIATPEAVAPVEVQVTIGHVEVRTAAAVPAAPPRRVARPSVSLEDYLRRRNGGAR